MRSLLLLLLFAVAAAAPPGTKRGYVCVPVWMDMKAGEAPLSAKDFSARLGGEPASIVAARGPGHDLMVLVVLDLTEDMGLVDIAKDALISTIDGLPPEAHVGLLRAQDGLHVLVDPTMDRQRLAAAIRTQAVSGKAGLLDTVEVAARIADAVLGKASVRVALVYVTDSDIHNYREDFINPVINSSDHSDMSRRFPEGLVREKISKLESKLAAFEAPLFVVHLDYRSDRLNEAYQAGLMQLTAAAGGTSTFCRSRAEIPDAIAGAFRTIAAHYSLVLRLPEHPSKVLQVQLENEHHNLTYRNRFVFQEK